MSKLHDKDEPKPWERLGLPVTLAMVGEFADLSMALLVGRGGDFGVISCDSCGRWQDFPPPFQFAPMRQKAHAAGWRRDGKRDLCPICAEN